MPRYLVERNLPQGMSEADVEDAVRRVIAVNVAIPEISWLHSNLAADRSKFFCEYEAPTPEVLEEAARLADLPADRVTEVIEIREEMFRL